jgi:hypothetical protein
MELLLLLLLLLFILLHVYMFVGMYEYYPFSSHNGITVANVLILIFSPVNDNFDLTWNYYYYYYYHYHYYYYTNCVILFCLYVFSLFLRTRANFVIRLWAVNFVR